MGVVVTDEIVFSASSAAHPPELGDGEHIEARRGFICWNAVMHRDGQQAFRKRDAGGSGIPSASSRSTIRSLGSFRMRCQIGCQIDCLLNTDENMVLGHYASIKTSARLEGGDAIESMTRC